MTEQSIRAYNNVERAQRYNTQTGFDPKRKERMLDAALQSLLELTPRGATLLELGAGTGLFTQKVLNTEHFAELHITDGAPAMLEIAQQQLVGGRVSLHFDMLDFAAPTWADRYTDQRFDAVISSMAIHHVGDKQQLFAQVFQVLKPGGIFVIADHLAGAAPSIDRLLGTERGRIKLATQGKAQNDAEAMNTFLQTDAAKQAAEGNQCESLGQYLQYLAAAGFQSADCLWRDYWLALFVAQKGK